MKSWRRPGVPRIAGFGLVPQVWDTATQQLLPAEPDGVATLYVCGITPYDATHLGHASTYLAYDTLIRAWLDAGFTVSYVQNVTDIDDPLLERAAATGVDWRALAASQTDLFRGDMEALGIIPPDHYVAVTDVIPEVASAVDLLLARGLAYEVDASGPGGSLDGEPDLYFDSAAAAAATSWHLGIESGYSRDRMLELFALRGGDPTRPGKRDPLDPLLWRGARHGEPAWQTVLGLGRPGWHIECSVIAVNHLGRSITVQGGGSDLRFPHHEFTAAHATALTGEPFANIYSHAGMVAYQGEKMSKSLGNLVLVSKLTAAGHDARVIRLALLSHHYRSDWEWMDADLEHATARLSSWLDWAARNDTGPSAGSAQSEAQPIAQPAAHQTAQPAAHPPLVERLRAAIGNDLDTPTALLAVDEVVRDCAGCEGCGASAIDAIHALLGIDLRG